MNDQQQQADPVAEARAKLTANLRRWDVQALIYEYEQAVEARAIAQWGSACAECGHDEAAHQWTDARGNRVCGLCLQDAAKYNASDHHFESRDDRLRRAAALPTAREFYEAQERGIAFMQRAEAAEARAQVYREALEAIDETVRFHSSDYARDVHIRVRAALAGEGRDG